MRRGTEPNDSTTIEAERQLLREMCDGGVSRDQIISTIDRLAGYVWLVPEHATVFQAIRSATRTTERSWRDLLPALATRMGFPDVEWSKYLPSGPGDAPFLNDPGSRRAD